jgi:hypothetical protein
MLGRERLAIGVRGQQRVLVAQEVDRHVGREALFRLCDSEARARPGPSNVMSNFDQRVTQWMSCVCPVRGNAFNSSQESETGFSTSPETPNVQPARSVDGIEPACNTGHFSVRYWPGGRRAGS